ncbi:hypothetical protein MCOR27_001115 [Pyricularia oryzae]|uniref:Elongator complex protein 5 n=2 Tax=Pyricularia TaxID=48558 RepID=A0ABQ8NXJ4_PYRGI|nr:hypothetical protein MCOR01_003151 [Pyricularia oryzae]KAI6303461.1 hypothetical protein MCOR33_001349 [Pyricularia grisea]KAH9432565.1 hypothetical protein MCOR02_007255 [Pyricularia oryzae]KAI6262296.1 hypothetical protein MCOR19_001489 [Pyricularia oryzae]KAI6276903.1 hypothetical protein MCOR26_005393 [Pyricularia oryzae]
MAPSTSAHRRSHSLLLVQKLLNLRDGASPLTLVLDSLDQTAWPLIREFSLRAKLSKTKIVFVSFATLKKPVEADIFIKARGKSLQALRNEIAAHCPDPKIIAQPGVKAVDGSKTLVIIDSLNALAVAEPRLLAVFLSSIVTPGSSVIGVYHADVPLVLPRSGPGSLNEYEPEPLTVLRHLATAVFRVSNLYQAVEINKARNRSEQEPEWGLREGREGVLIGMQGAIAGDSSGGIVLEMEMRRRSGRAASEKFVLVPPAIPSRQGTNALASVNLLSDHPAFATPLAEGDANASTPAGAEEEMETTFNLGLTEKQRQDRDGIVLPYFDAQTEIGGGEGGRILYEMGREDDFDDEEDEI